MPQVTLARGRVYSYSHIVGRTQDAPPPGFSYPYGMAVGKDGMVYVANRSAGNHPCVSKVYVGGPGEEEYIVTIGDPGREDGKFVWVDGVALDREENVYVVDNYLHRISIFDKDGKFLRKWGTPGSDPGELLGPSRLAIDGEGNVYVVDTRNHRVQKFTNDGILLGGWGGYGSRDGEFHLPWGITIDHQGDVYIADWKNHRVQKFSPEGSFLAQFGWPAEGAGIRTYPKSYPRNHPFSHLWRLGSGNRGELNHPSGVAVDMDGDVYVSDWGNNRVQIYQPDGEFFAAIYGDAHDISKWQMEKLVANPDSYKAFRRSKHPEQIWPMRMPTDIGIDHDKSWIYIVDSIKKRLMIYIKDKDYVDPQFNL